MKANGAEVIGAFLKNAGVSYIFGLMGSPMMPIMDKVHAAGDVRFVPTLHEQGAMFIAVVRSLMVAPSITRRSASWMTTLYAGLSDP